METSVLNLNSIKIGVIGLGYVGLPLAVEFGKSRPVVGFDINEKRIQSLRSGKDATLELSDGEVSEAVNLSFTSQLEDLAECNVYIVSVPTPVDEFKRPDISLLRRASETVGRVLGKGDIVIYESTVYPGATEEDCVPILAATSGLEFNNDFFVGYSPERINPGDKEHRLTGVVKVTSGSTPEATEFVDALYGEIIIAGTHKAPSIRVAEAAKVIENIQRDVNIALMNELSLIFGRMGIDTMDVLDAARTKWNFLPFRPGLVGGHCIGVDPYYLTHKAQEYGYHPEVILAGRRINDSIGAHIAEQVVKLMLNKACGVHNSRVLVLGFTFKEDCPDVRNTKVVDIVRSLAQFHATVDVYDPWVNPDEAFDEFGVRCLSERPKAGTYDAIVVAVGHRQFVEWGHASIASMGRAGAIIYDVKSILPLGVADGRL